MAVPRAQRAAAKAFIPAKSHGLTTSDDVSTSVGAPEPERKQALGGMDAATRANWGAFDGKLEAAIAQQAHEIERRQTRLQAAQTEFVEMQKRLKSLETLAARQQEATRQKGMRREQKQTDEIAARSNPALTSPALTTNTLSRSSEAPASTLHW